MNKVILMGRLTKDPDIRYSQSGEQQAIARYTLAVDRMVSRNQNSDEPTADFIGCVAFGRTAEFAEKYFHKGIKIAIEGHIRTGRYQNKDGQTVFTTDVVVDRQEFCESKNSSGGGSMFDNGSYSNSGPGNGGAFSNAAARDDFINIPEGIDEELPFG